MSKLARGGQVHYVHGAATVGVDDGTTFGYMASSGLLLAPVAFFMMGAASPGPSVASLDAHVRYAAFDLVGALFPVMGLNRVMASTVAPTTGALALAPIVLRPNRRSIPERLNPFCLLPCAA